MASKNYYVVKRGDTLWGIATKYKSKIAGKNTNAKVDTLVEVNDIEDRNKIAIDQTIYFSASAKTKASGTTPKSQPEVTLLSLQASGNDDHDGRTVMAFWDWTRDSTAGYACRWYEYVNESGVKKWIQNTSGDVYIEKYEKRFCYNSYTASKNALQVKFHVRPVDAFKNGKPTFFKAPVGDWSDAKIYNFDDNPPGLPPTPAVKIDENEPLKLVIDLQWDDYQKADATYVNFNICKNKSTDAGTIKKVAINPDSNHAKDEFTVEYGNTYTVRAQSVSAKGKTSGWSAFSSEVATIPVAPKTVEQPYWRKQDDGKILIYLEWSAVPSATQYVIEYTTDEGNFNTGTNNADGVQSVETTGNNTKVEIPIANSNDESFSSKLFFRVRAKKGDQESNPSGVVTITIGENPAPPTTWSSANSAFVREPMELNWVHNARDGSLQYEAQLRLTINADEPIDYLVVNKTTPNSGDTIVTGETDDDYNWTYLGELVGTFYSYKGNLHFKMNTANSKLKNAKIQWEVRTFGITHESSDSDWSESRIIYIYEKPTLELSVTKDEDGNVGFEDVREDGILVATKALRTFPFYIHAKPYFESGDDSVVLYYAVTYNEVNDSYTTILNPIAPQSGSVVANKYTTDNDTVYKSDDGAFYTKRLIQQPIGYNVRIVSNEYYETVDAAGRSKIVNVGDEVYSQYFNADGKPLMITMTADMVDLEPDISYGVLCDMGMSTGLPVSASDEFSVYWADVSHNIDASVIVDTDSYSATIIPTCIESVYYAVNHRPGVGRPVHYIVEYDSLTGDYTATTEAIMSPSGSLVEGVYTTDNDPVYKSEGISYCFIVEYDSATGDYTTTPEVIETPFGGLVKDAYTTDNNPVYESDDGSCFYTIRTVPYYYTKRMVPDHYIVEYDSETGDYTITTEVVESPSGSLVEGAFTVDNDPVYESADGTYFYTSRMADEYAVSSEIIESPEGGPLDGVYTTDDRLVYVSDDGSYHYVKTDKYVEGITLSVYRIDYNGTFTEIATNIPNDGTSVTDPHPALDYARYRIVAKVTDTGALTFYDLPPYEVGCTSVVVQWDEEWRSYGDTGAVAAESPLWSGSMLVLPYNIKISDKRTRETSRVTYAGREYPVLYHGTAIDESSSWSTVIPTDDTDTIYALRRLSLWAGPAYVREPSGMGFWANVIPSFNIDGTSVTIPVTLDVTRVEGGV